MSSAPEAMFLKYGQASEDLINTMEDLLNNYFTTNHIQRAVIYDVRIQNDKILFDCTLGKYFKITIDPKLGSLTPNLTPTLTPTQTPTQSQL